MRVQDINGHWYEVDDAILAKCEVKVERESGPAEPLANPVAGMRSRASGPARESGSADGSTPAEGRTESSC
jgi:hypothetical protein